MVQRIMMYYMGGENMGGGGGGKSDVKFGIVVVLEVKKYITFHIFPENPTL